LCVFGEKHTAHMNEIYEIKNQKIEPGDRPGVDENKAHRHY